MLQRRYCRLQFWIGLLLDSRCHCDAAIFGVLDTQTELFLPFVLAILFFTHIELLSFLYDISTT